MPRLRVICEDLWASSLQDGTWHLVGGSIIQILLNVGKRKMGIFRRKLPVNLICLEKEQKLSTS